MHDDDDLLACPVTLTSRMVAIDTVNPPGNEADLADGLRPLLERLGLVVETHVFRPGRATLIAYPADHGGKPLLGFTGHLDTVPLGEGAWGVPPFSGEVRNGKLFGRGSSDMKSGIAAFLHACHVFRATQGKVPGVLLILTAAEESGAEGAAALQGYDLGDLRVGALVVGEPTANRVVIGHKGALWLRASIKGRSAHGSMPEEGDNAILKAVQVLERVCAHRVEPAEDPLLGRATVNPGTFHAGANLNSVPDLAELEFDFRTVSTGDNSGLLRELAGCCPEVVFTPLVDVPAIRTAPDDPWVLAVIRAAECVTGPQGQPGAVSFFTDGPALHRIFGTIPTVILGPGEPTMAHKTDEFCRVQDIRDAADIYMKLLDIPTSQGDMHDFH